MGINYNGYFTHLKSSKPSLCALHRVRGWESKSGLDMAPSNREVALYWK